VGRGRTCSAVATSVFWGDVVDGVFVRLAFDG
jgi:hypothetical protein